MPKGPQFVEEPAESFPSGEESEERVPEEGEGVSESTDTKNEKPGADGVLYLVLDDVGYQTDNLERFLSLPIPITYAVLPKLPDTALSVEKIERAGAEYILHQPMEPLGKQDPGPGAIDEKMKRGDVRRVVSENLKELPKAVGVNNHMGSRITSDPKIMAEVLALLGEKGLFFLDSRTTSKTVARGIAEEMRVAFTERNVFLDNESTQEYIEAALEKGKEIAAKSGYAVLIGHVWSDELYEVLLNTHEDIEEEGYYFDDISGLFRKETARAGTGD